MIDPFALVKEKMEIYVNLRIEMHGEDKVSAYDVKLSGNFSNSVLLKLHPELRDTFYKAGDQADVEDFKRELRFPMIDNKAIQWALEIPRTMLRLHDVQDSGEDLVLTDGKTKKFEFDMLEGGTVKLSFLVQLGELEEEQVTKLLRANGQTMPISLESAPTEEKPDNFEQADLLSQGEHSDARKEAENAFKAPPADPNMTPEQVVQADTWTNPPPVEAKKKRKPAAGRPSLTVQ